MRLNLLLILISLLITASTVYSAPVITTLPSNPTAGASATIGGSGFGASPTVHFYTDFEQGSDGAQIPTGTLGANVGSIAAATTDKSLYESSAKFSGNLSFQTTQEETSYGSVTIALPENTRSVYMSWQVFIPGGDYYPGGDTNDGVNWKNVWLLGWDANGDTLINDGDISIPTLLGYDQRPTDPPNALPSWQINGNKDPGLPLFYAEYTNTGLVKGQWSRFSAWVKGGDATAGELLFTTTDATTGTIVRRDDGPTHTLYSQQWWNRVNVNGYARTPSVSHPTFDDVYIAVGANAQARVEIGDEPVYADCTRLSIAPESARTATSISVTLPLMTGTSYIYVFTADGSVDVSGPITIAAAVDIHPLYTDGSSLLVGN